MRKPFVVLALVLALCTFTLADGGVPINGRQCPPAPEPCPNRLATPVDTKPLIRSIALREIIRNLVRLNI